jgi:hypothetical protein
MAEGSDWFWWFGDDQDSGRDSEFDDLFRMHLRNIYRSLRADPPASLDEAIVPHVHVWDYGTPGSWAPPGFQVAVRTRAPGTLTIRPNGGPAHALELTPVGGVMSGTTHYQVNLGVPAPGTRFFEIDFDGAHDEPPGFTRVLHVSPPDA